MAICSVYGTLKTMSGGAAEGVTVSARVLLPYVDSTEIVTPQEVSTVTSSDGSFTLDVTRNAPVLFVINYPPTTTDARRSAAYSALIPATASAQFASIIILE
jgi:hypothetical protein